MKKSVILEVITKKKELLNAIYKENSGVARLALLMNIVHYFEMYRDCEIKHYIRRKK